MILIIAEGGSGECTQEGVENNDGLFECVECSNDACRVFHNVRGKVRHVSQGELSQMLGIV